MIKFQNRDKIESLQKGKLYMKSLAYYRERERETGDDTVGDLFEAMIHINNGYIIIPELGINEKLSDALINTNFANSFVFCLLSLAERTETFKFSDEQKKKILDFGDSALLITDRDKFLQRIETALERQNLEYHHDYVDYYDETKDNIIDWISLISNRDEYVAFRKRIRYAYQQEYRFLIKHPPTEEDYFELDIGNIEGISVILTAEEALSAIVNPKSE